jgi:hypothetical protein
VNDNQGFRFGPILGCGGLPGNEFDIIIEADDFPTCVGFYVPLGNLTRFIIEETM